MDCAEKGSESAQVERLKGLVEALGRWLRDEQGDPAASQRCIETHISVLLLSATRAYKFKKPVDLGFADFTTLARRRHFCEEELRLNRRFAPALYEEVVAVTGTAEAPALTSLSALDPAAAPLDYAVRMRRFDTNATADVLASRNALEADQLVELIDALAAFHGRAERVSEGAREGSPALIRAQVLDALEGIETPDAHVWRQLRETLDGLAGVFARRQGEGFVRDCHGDLHLGNVVSLDGHLTPFDCIEFNRELRLIDTVADLAFLLMDLDYRERVQLANVAFNRYFEVTGDHAGLAVLRLYLAYRSLVRAKVASLQAASQTDPAARRGQEDGARRHVALAGRYLAACADRPPALWITHGLSGSGKSWHSQRLARVLGWLHLRSDVERKRLLGLSADASTASGIGTGAYSEDMSERTYEHLAAVAAGALRSGFTTIVDASFLARGQRDRFREVAEQAGVPWGILDCSAPLAVLRERVRTRREAGRDPSEADEAVIDHQLATRDPLGEDEGAVCVDAARVSEAPGAAALAGRPRV